MATYYFDPINGNDSNDGLSFVNRKKFITGFTASAGDDLRVIASSDPTSMSQSASWTNNSPTVTLTTAVTDTITNCDSAWTSASANVTANTITGAGNYKEGSAAARFIFSSGFTTGKAAYLNLGTTKDLSGYQQVSFWFQILSGSFSSDNFELRLCSDTTGDTTVDTIVLPAGLTAGAYHAVTVDTGAALGSSIQSIALYINTDMTNPTVYFDNIIACKASSSSDSLTLNSLIGKNAAGETWYPIQSISGTTVTIGAAVTVTAGSTNLRGYSGTTESATIYKREGLLLTSNGSQTSSSWANMSFSGTSSSPVTISGGWNRTDMSTQTGETWMLQSSNNNVGMSASSRGWINISKINCVQFYTGFYLPACNNISITDCSAIANFAYGFFGDTTAGNLSFSSCYAFLNGSYGIVPGCEASVVSMKAHGNGVNNYYLLNSHNSTLSSCSSSNSSSIGVDFDNSCNIKVIDFTSTSNNTAAFSIGRGRNFFINSLISDTTEQSGSISYSGGAVFSHKHDQTTDNHRIWTDVGIVVSDTGADRHTASGMVWKLSPTSANAVATYPMEVSLAKIACRANKLVTVKVWEKRSTSTITAKLVCKGGQIAGVANDVTATAAGANNTYEQISITFTPTEQGVVEIVAQAYGGTSDNAWFDDLTVYQA